MTDVVFPLKVRAIRVDQPMGAFYLTCLSARALLRVAYSDRLRVVEADDDGYRVRGTQRKEKAARHSDIRAFIETSEAILPTPIILAANYTINEGAEGVVEADDQRRWTIERGSDNDSELYLVIPTHGKLASIVDGQHRLHAFQKLMHPDRLGMELPCAVFFDLPNPYQAYVFATVNFNQKKVDRSLAYELFGFESDEEDAAVWTPEKTAVFLCRRLSTDPESPLQNHIKVAAAQEQEGSAIGTAAWTVSTATVVDGLLGLFSSRPSRDRVTMLKKRVSEGRRRSDLVAERTDRSPLRQQYLAVNDRLIYAIVRNYFAAVETVFWEPSRAGSYLQKTVGVQALFDVLKHIVTEMVESKDLREAAFVERLRPAGTIDFSADAFRQASGQGRIVIRDAILVALGRRAAAERIAEE